MFFQQRLDFGLEKPNLFGAERYAGPRRFQSVIFFNSGLFSLFLGCKTPIREPLRRTKRNSGNDESREERMLVKRLENAL
jgi:hypothetical protein